MKLKDIIDNIEKLDENKVIFSRKPWTYESDTEITELDENEKIPVEIINLGLDYFLEISVAKEVISVLSNFNSTIEDRRKLLIFYAENDAYPKWVFRNDR